MTRILTLTPNPAVDISTSTERIVPFSKLRCTTARRDPGGGGINVARVIRRLGGEVLAVYPAGGSSGRRLAGLLAGEGVPCVEVPVSAETREDFMVFEVATGLQYRFVLPGAELSDGEWQECLAALTGAEPPDLVVVSGSLPAGAPEDFYGRVARLAKGMKAKTIVDTSGPPLKAALKEGVYLIKPNLREFQELVGRPLADQAAWIEAGRSLIDRGEVELIALTLGHRGALLIAREEVLVADGLPIKPISVVGAGDSFTGAMTWSLASGHTIEQALKFGVAAGSATVLRPGTELCRVEDVRRLAADVITRQL